MQQYLIDDKSTLIPARAWCCQAVSHSLKQCSSRSLLVTFGGQVCVSSLYHQNNYHHGVTPLYGVPQQEGSRRALRTAVISPETELLMSGRQGMFQRSISEITGSSTSVENLDAYDGSVNKSRRRRNNSGTLSGGYTSVTWCKTAVFPVC